MSELMTVPTSSDLPASRCAGLQASTAHEGKEHLLRKDLILRADIQGAAVESRQLGARTSPHSDV